MLPFRVIGERLQFISTTYHLLEPYRNRIKVRHVITDSPVQSDLSPSDQSDSFYELWKLSKILCTCDY